MYLVHVAPITKIPFPNPQILTYFFDESPRPGVIVEVPLHHRVLPALVMESEPLKKITIKRAPYQVRHAARILTQFPLFDEYDIQLAEWLSAYYYSPLGLVLKTILPNYLLRKGGRGFQGLEEIPQRTISKNSSAVPPTLLWHDKRAAFYNTQIEKSLKRGEQVIFLVPEIDRINGYLTLFKKQWGEKVSSLSGQLSEKQYFTEWSKFRSGTTRIIVGTRSAIFAKPERLGLIIVDEEEQESHGSWDQHPRYNARDVAIKLGSIKNTRVVLGSALASLRSYANIKTGNYTSAIKKPRISMKRIKEELMDMKAELKRGNYSIFSTCLKTSLDHIIKNKERALLFITRRGFASFILCRECGFIVNCMQCDAPMVYHRKNPNAKIQMPNKAGGRKEDYALICHHCGRAMNAPNVCPSCGGHKIRYFGAGTEQVEEELKSIFPAARAKRLDSDTAPNPKERLALLNEFKKGTIRILVGTQLLLKEHLLPRADLVAVVSTDLLLNLPDFRANERVFQLLQKLRGAAKHEFIVQTYNPDAPVFHYRNPEIFYKDELETRKTYGWPPFSQLIKLTYSHKNSEKAKHEAIVLREKLKTQIKYLATSYQLATTNFDALGPAPAFIPKLKGKYIYHILVKCQMPNAKCQTNGLTTRNKLLEIVPADWTIDVDPIEVI